jgi:hypothetical protein
VSGSGWSAAEPDRKDSWVRVASNKGAMESICILFLHRGFNPKKEGDFSIVSRLCSGEEQREIS